MIKLSLTINNNPIDCNEFVTNYIVNICKAIIISLQTDSNDENMNMLVLSISHNNVSLIANNKAIEIRKLFVEDIIRDTVIGMCKNLKGVENPQQIIIELNF